MTNNSKVGNTDDDGYSADWMKDGDTAGTGENYTTPATPASTNATEFDNEQQPSWSTTNNDEEKGQRTTSETTATTPATGDSAPPLSSESSSESLTRIQKIWEYDKPLLICIAVMIIVLNIPGLRFILYPFLIFSTWVHELCHGMAALMIGGTVTSLHIYPDGSGRAYWYYVGQIPDGKGGFVSSAGYTGTAVIGCLLLLIRRKKLVPPVGLIVIGCSILLCIFCWIRNAFGICILLLFSLILIAMGAAELKFHDYLNEQKKIPFATILVFMYSLLAATCSFNAVDSIGDLYHAGSLVVNGQPVASDAHSVAEYWGAAYGFWATWWLLIALACSFVGLVFALDQ